MLSDSSSLYIRRIHLKASQHISFAITNTLQFGKLIPELDIKPNDFLLAVDEKYVNKKGRTAALLKIKNHKIGSTFSIDVLKSDDLPKQFKITQKSKVRILTDLIIKIVMNIFTLPYSVSSNVQQ